MHRGHKRNLNEPRLFSGPTLCAEGWMFDIDTFIEGFGIMIEYCEKL